MPKYKLIYFNIRGRAELSRLILLCAQVPFEDYRIEYNEWPSIKQSKMINYLINSYNRQIACFNAISLQINQTCHSARYPFWK